MVAALPPNVDWPFWLLAIPIFLGFWSLVMAGISLLGGWHGLGKFYRREETKFSIGDGGAVERFRWASLKMGPNYFPTNYGNCVTVSLSGDGVGLQVMLIFRPLHPPLLIPWAAIESCQGGKELRVFDVMAIQVHDVPHPIRIYGRAGRAIERYWTAHLAPHPPRE